MHDWQSDPREMELSANGLAPGDSSEAATVQTLAPGAYTVIASADGNSAEVGLVEIYDLSAASEHAWPNISTRGVPARVTRYMIGGFVVGDVASATVVIRALGPSLGSTVMEEILADPRVTVFDSNGVAIPANDNWQDDINATDVEENGLAPTNPAEAAMILHPPGWSLHGGRDRAWGLIGSELAFSNCCQPYRLDPLVECAFGYALPACSRRFAVLVSQLDNDRPLCQATRQKRISDLVEDHVELVAR